MSTTHNPESLHGLRSLHRAATRIVLAGGVGMAVIGLGAGTANADPPSAASLTCPADAAPGPGTVTPENFQGHVTVWGGVAGRTIEIGQGDAGGPVPVIWPDEAGKHHFFAASDVAGPPPQGFIASCDVEIGDLRVAPAPGGGASPAEPPACPSRPPSSCASDPGVGPIQRQQ